MRIAWGHHRAALLRAILALALGAAPASGAVLGQTARRPDSRAASYPTARPLAPPAPTTFKTEWERALPGERITGVTVDSAPGTDGGVARRVFALASSGRLFCLDAASGEPLWTADDADPSVLPVPLGDAIIIRDSRGGVAVLDALQGKRRAPLRDPVARWSLLGCGGQTLSAAGPLWWLPPSARAASPESAFEILDPCEAAPAGVVALPAPLVAAPVPAGGFIWALLTSGPPGTPAPPAEDRCTWLYRAAATPPGTGLEPFEAQRALPGARSLVADPGPPPLIAVARSGGILEVISGLRGTTRWSVRTGTDLGAPPLFVTTGPPAAPPRDPERLVIAPTADGLLVAYTRSNGNLAWTTRASARISRPLAVAKIESPADPDSVRLLVAAEGSRKLEAFRALDGAPAGSFVLEPEAAVILSAPVVALAPEGGQEAATGLRETLCFLAWSPYPPAGSRLLAVRLSPVR